MGWKERPLRSVVTAENHSMPVTSATGEVRWKREYILLYWAVREPLAKLLASNAEKKATWPRNVENHRGDGKVATPLRCRETS